MPRFCIGMCLGLLSLVSCGGGGPAPTFTVSGVVTGLLPGNSLTLQDNGDDALTIVADGPFTFPAALTTGTTYHITVSSEPTGEACLVGAGSGEVTQNVTSVAVSCAPPNVVYTADDTGISEFSVDTTTGSLTPLAESPLVAPYGPYSIAVDPKDRYAYVVGLGGYTVGYAIAPESGALSELSSGPYPEYASSTSITVDPTSKFVLSPGVNGVSVYSIDQASGALAAVPGSPFAAGAQPYAVTVDPNGKFVYTANSADATISAFSLNESTGELTPVAGSPFSAGGQYPQSIAIDPTGTSLYVADSGDLTVAGFTIDSTTGALTPNGYAPNSSDGAVAVIVDRSGRFVYIATAFRIDGFIRNTATGVLTPMQAPFYTGQNFTSRASAMAVDRSGKFLYVVNHDFKTVAGFAIDPATGFLNTVPGSPFSVAPDDSTSPIGIATSM